jgi:tubulin beta
MINLIDITEKYLKYSATCIINSTAIQQVWRRLLNQFDKMFKKKAFLHWYIGEGMDEMEFIEGDRSISDLISEYQQYDDMVAYEEYNVEEVKYEEDLFFKKNDF